jgi:hypothetical protein
MMKSIDDVKIYFVTIPAHKFLHIKNCESNGYWDFWQKQSLIPGQDCKTICGLLDSIRGKLDDAGGSESNSGSGQVMAYMNDPERFWKYTRPVRKTKSIHKSPLSLLSCGEGQGGGVSLKYNL